MIHLKNHADTEDIFQTVFLKYVLSSVCFESEAVSYTHLFRALAEEGTAILFITHDLDLALEAADRIVVLYAGETVEEAAAEDFQEVDRLRHPYTLSLIHI